MRQPTAFEQDLLQYINRARMDPAGEFDALIANAGSRTAVASDITTAIRYFGVDLALFREQLAAYDPVAPLAWNGLLADAAPGHSRLMIDQDTQAHQLSGEAALGPRILATGYPALRWAKTSSPMPRMRFTPMPVSSSTGAMVRAGCRTPPGIGSRS